MEARGSRRTKVKALRNIKKIVCEKSFNDTLENEKFEDSFDVLRSSPAKQVVNFKPLSFWSQKVKDLESKENVKKKKCALYELSDAEESSSSERKKPKKTGQRRRNKKLNNNCQFDMKNLAKKPNEKRRSTQKKDGSIIREKIVLKRLNEQYYNKEDKFLFSDIKSFGLTSTPGKSLLNVVGGSTFEFLSPIAPPKDSYLKRRTKNMELKCRERSFDKCNASIDCEQKEIFATPKTCTRSKDSLRHYKRDTNFSFNNNTVQEQPYSSNLLLAESILDPNQFSEDGSLNKAFLHDSEGIVYLEGETLERKSANSPISEDSVKCSSCDSQIDYQDWDTSSGLPEEPEFFCANGYFSDITLHLFERSLDELVTRPTFSSLPNIYFSPDVNHNHSDRSYADVVIDSSIESDSVSSSTSSDYSAELPLSSVPHFPRKSNFESDLLDFKSEHSVIVSERDLLSHHNSVVKGEININEIGALSSRDDFFVTYKRTYKFLNFRQHAKDEKCNEFPSTSAHDMTQDVNDTVKERLSAHSLDSYNDSDAEKTFCIFDASCGTMLHASDMSKNYFALREENGTDKSEQMMSPCSTSVANRAGYRRKKSSRKTLFGNRNSKVGSNQYCSKEVGGTIIENRTKILFNAGSDSSIYESPESPLDAASQPVIGAHTRWENQAEADDCSAVEFPSTASSSAAEEVFARDVTFSDGFELPLPIFESTVCKTPVPKKIFKSVFESTSGALKFEAFKDNANVTVIQKKSSDSVSESSIFSETGVNDVTSFILKPGKQWVRSALTLKKLQNGTSLIDDPSTMTLKGRNYRTFVNEVLSMQVVAPEESLSSMSRVVNQMSSLSVSGRNLGRRTIKVLGDYDEDELQSPFRSFVIHNSVSGILSSTVRESFVENLELTTKAVAHTTARDLVLMRCNQDSPLSFEHVFDEITLKHCKKIGEGAYGEVFMSYPNRVFKIIPIEGDYPVNGEPQKRFDEILSEMVIAMELSNLRKSEKFRTSGFSELKQCSCLMGKYPQRLVDLWDDYDSIGKGSENDSPLIFKSEQLYLVLEFENGGKDLESFVFNSAEQSLSIFLQVAVSLAVAERALEFEHRDLHWGNILIQQTKEKNFTSIFCGEEYEIPTKGVKVTIIDFTLSRISCEGCTIFNNLSVDPSLFISQGDYQFEIYRMMKSEVMDDWSNFRPKTNLFWMHYVLDKMIAMARYKRTNTKVHRTNISALSDLKSSILKYSNSEEFLFGEELI